MKRLIPILLLIFFAQMLIGCTDEDFPRFLTKKELKDGRITEARLKIESIGERPNFDFESLSIRYRGTGFIVSANHVLTARHVIDDCKKVTVTKGSQQIDSRILAVSSMADLGLLITNRHFEDVAKFRRQHISVGNTVLKYGYSIWEPAVGPWTKGSITSQWGVNSGGRTDMNLLEYDAPTYGGDSGGPLLDQSGHVVGIVVSGARTQFNAVTSGAAEFFLDTNFVMYEEGDSTQDLNLQAVARQAKDFTVKVECWQ